MPNIFIRTNVTPYRVDTYNALHEILGCRMYFMYDMDSSQAYKMDRITKRCHFKSNILTQGKIFGITYFKKILRIFRENNPEIIVVPEFKVLTLRALAYKWLFNRKVRVISMCDDSYDMVANGKDFTKVHTIARKIVTPLLDDLLLVDDKVCRWYKDKYGKGIWLPIMRDEKNELPLYEAAKAISSRFSERYGLKDKKILLYVGRLSEEKNLSTLIEAIEHTKEAFTTVIIGDGPLKDQLMLQAQTTGKEILFPGRFDDAEIRAWFIIGDVFVLPSTQEAFGAVTNEALLGGCFVLLSSACGSSCLINENNGRTFDPHDTESLAELIDEAFKKLPENGNKKENRMGITFEDMVIKTIKQLDNKE